MKKILLILFLPILAWGQATVVQSPVPQFQSFNASGVPNVSGCVYTFASGTSTPQATYTDATGLITNTNPVRLDGTGSAQIWITSQVYRFQVWTFGSGTVGSNCGGGTQLYQIDGIKDSGLAGPSSNLAAVVTVQTTTNTPTITTINPVSPSQNYNIPDPGTGGNFIINPSGNSGTSNTLDCTLSGITCKRTASYYFRGGQCNSTTPSLGWDTFGINAPPTAQCFTGTNIQKGALGMPSAYNRTQTNTGTSTAAGTITTTYPAAIPGGNGDLLVLSVAFNGTTTVTGCTDGTNAYTQAKHVTNGALSLDIWYFLNPTTKAAGTTLTCTYGANATGAIRWHEYQTLNAVSLDVTASNTGTSNSITTGTTASTAQATELSFAAAGNISGAGITNSASGYAEHTAVISGTIAVDDAGIIAQTIATQAGSFTTSGSPAWAGAIATFKATNGVSAVAQQTVVLPSFYNSAVAVNSSLKWFVANVPSGSSTVSLGAALVCVPDGNTDDVVFNADTTATGTVSNVANNLPTTTALNGLAVGSCAAGQTLHFQVKRLRYNANDTYEGFVDILGAVFQIGITQ